MHQRPLPYSCLSEPVTEVDKHYKQHHYHPRSDRYFQSVGLWPHLDEHPMNAWMQPIAPVHLSVYMATSINTYLYIYIYYIYGWVWACTATLGCLPDEHISTLHIINISTSPKHLERDSTMTRRQNIGNIELLRGCPGGINVRSQISLLSIEIDMVTRFVWLYLRPTDREHHRLRLVRVFYNQIHWHVFGIEFSPRKRNRVVG